MVLRANSEGRTVLVRVSATTAPAEQAQRVIVSSVARWKPRRTLRRRHEDSAAVSDAVPIFVHDLSDYSEHIPNRLFRTVFVRVRTEVFPDQKQINNTDTRACKYGCKTEKA